MVPPPATSGRVIVTKLLVDVPVSLNPFVAGLDDDPERYRSEKGKVDTPRLSEPAVAGWSTELRATVPRLLRVLLA
jgi:hypothetical protein